VARAPPRRKLTGPAGCRGVRTEGRSGGASPGEGEEEEEPDEEAAPERRRARRAGRRSSAPPPGPPEEAAAARDGAFGEAAGQNAAAAAEAAAPSPEVFVRIGQTPGSSHRLWAALDREGLGEWAPLLSSRRAQVTVDDLPLLVESDFEKLGIPLGPRKRLAALAKRMWDESLARDDLLPPPLSPTPSLALA